MGISVGIDIAKEMHWVTAIDADGVVRIDRKLANTPGEIAQLITELGELGRTVRIGLDVIGGIAGLAEAMLAAAGFALVHVSGLAVNRARQGTRGGENKSDPRDARTIADQVRARSDLRPIQAASELDLEIRLLVGRRRDLVDGQTQRLARLHDLLVGIFPGLERTLDLTTKGPLHLLTRFVTPAELRAAGKKRLVRHLQAAGGLPKVEALAERALAAAAEQTIAVPAERMTSRLVRSWGPCSPPNSSPRQTISPASARPTRSPRPAASLPFCASPARPAFCVVPSAATKASSASSTSPPSARSVMTTAAPSTTASGARENATIRPSSPWPAGASMSSGPSSNPAPPSRPGSKQPLDLRMRLPPPHHRVAERYWRSYGARFESRALASCRGHANCAVAARIVR